jgi:hypothetical protein
MGKMKRIFGRFWRGEELKVKSEELKSRRLAFHF